jgi:adenylate cyclase
MLDRPREQTGFFYNHIAFVLESDTEDPSFPGEPYNLKTSDTHDWRRLSLTPVAADGRNFHHSKLSDADNWYLPRFDTDAWGTWFTGWRVLNFTGKSYNSLSVDFDAKTVSSLMLRIGLWVVGGGVFLLGMVFLLARHLSRRLSRPIEALKGGAEAVMSQKYEHKVPVFGRDEFSRLTEVFNRMITWVGEMINLKAALSKMLSEELAESAAKDGLVLGGERVQCTIMFTDFAGFSSIAQGLKPEETVQLLNLYFGELIPIIKQQGGFPDKYIGDAIVAIFGAPIRLENHAEQAVKAAVKLQRRIRQINEERRAAGEVVFEMRVGLNSGEVLVGAIGCDMKLQYTAIGEAANMANRMEAVCPIGHVALSESTGRQVRESCLDALQVRVESVEEDLKGYDAPVSVRRVWVDDLEIVKPSSLEDTRRYYRYD